MIKIEMMDTDKGYSLAASGHAGYAPAGRTSCVRRFLCWRRRWQTR